LNVTVALVKIRDCSNPHKTCWDLRWEARSQHTEAYGYAPNTEPVS